MSISVVADESDVIVPVVAATGESSPAGDSIAAPENDTGMIFRTQNTRFLAALSCPTICVFGLPVYLYQLHRSMVNTLKFRYKGFG